MVRSGRDQTRKPYKDRIMMPQPNLAGLAVAVPPFPKTERGYFHLTPRGWERRDTGPFPSDRCETWLYEMEREAPDAKQQVTLARIWRCPNYDPALDKDLYALFGDPVQPSSDRNVTLKCYV